MILSTIPGMVVLGGSGIRALSRFSAVILADLAMRGFAISFRTLAYVASPAVFLRFLCAIHPSWYLNGSHAAPFSTVPNDAGRITTTSAPGTSRHSSSSKTNRYPVYLDPRGGASQGRPVAATFRSAVVFFFLPVAATLRRHLSSLLRPCLACHLRFVHPGCCYGTEAAAARDLLSLRPLLRFSNF
jgi:hypothetical protein